MTQFTELYGHTLYSLSNILEAICINSMNVLQGAYPDLSSYMLMTQASINDLQTKVPSHINVSHRQFRPNFLVNGTQPYEEDNWKWIKIGDEAIFQTVKPCTR